MRPPFDRKALRAVKRILSILGTVDEMRYRLSLLELRPRYRILVAPWREPVRHVFRATLQVLDPFACLKHRPLLPLDKTYGPLPPYDPDLVASHRFETCPHWTTLGPLGLLHLKSLMMIEEDLDIPFRDGVNDDYEGCSFVLVGDEAIFFNPERSRILSCKP